MNRFLTHSLLAAVSTVVVTGAASAATMKFDVGVADTAGNINSITWNAQDIADAIDTNGDLTGVSLTVTSATGFNEAGPNTSGTSTPGAPASGFFTGETTNDALFGHSNNFNVGAPRLLVEYTIAGLDPSLAYDFTFYADRGAGSDIRETAYDVVGANSGQSLHNAIGGANTVGQVLGIAPTAGGQITLTIQAGPNNNNGSGFFYLGGLDITSVPEPTSFALLGLAGLGLVARRRTV